MKVLRMVPNIAAGEMEATVRFYRDVLGLDVVMDMGWIVTLGSGERMSVQTSVMTEGGSGTPVPDISIEVDDVDEALGRVRSAGVSVEYGPADEPWNVRRFYVRDPAGRLLNILQHR